jgi:hypothetical protein
VNEWFTLQTFVAFLVGVLLSAMVKGWVSQAKAKLT